MKAAELRARIVARLERENEESGWPEFWRMRGGRAQVTNSEGYILGRWFEVPFLSVYLLKRYHDRKYAEQTGIPY